MAFLALGLPYNASIADIKRAYAERLQYCSPETDPEGWMRLHNAYRAALRCRGAEAPETSGPETQNSFAPPARDSGGAGAEPESPYQSMFDQIEALAADAEEAERRRRKKHKAEYPRAQAEQPEATDGPNPEAPPREPSGERLRPSGAAERVRKRKGRRRDKHSKFRLVLDVIFFLALLVYLTATGRPGAVILTLLLGFLYLMTAAWQSK